VNGGGTSDDDEEESSEEDESGDENVEAAEGAPTSTAIAALAALSAAPPGARGGLFRPDWLAAAAKCFDAHMGAENLGTALYALCRFTKPGHVLEVGGGYTSVFILQALADNDAEMAALTAAGSKQAPVAGMAAGTEWHVGAEVRRLAGRGSSVLHVLDDLSHAYSTAGVVRRVAKTLKIDAHLRLHVRDAWEGPPEACTRAAGFGVGGYALGGLRGRRAARGVPARVLALRRPRRAGGNSLNTHQLRHSRVAGESAAGRGELRRLWR